MTIQTMRQPALGITPIANAKVKFPTYGSSEAACFDLWLPTNAKETATIIAPGQSAVFGLGYSMTIPEGWELKIYSRSGQGFKKGLRLVNCVGIIDADYTGEIKVGLYNDSAVDQVVCAVDAIAQGQLIPLPPRPAFFFATELKTTERGSGGFGSTDVSAAEFNSSVPVPESVELSAAPAVPVGWKLVPVEPTPEMWKAAKSVPDPNPPYPPHYGLVWDAMLAASPTPPAEQQAAPKAAPQPAPAPLSDDVSQKVWALLDELEKLRSVNREEEDWDTLNKRSDELRAVLAA